MSLKGAINEEESQSGTSDSLTDEIGSDEDPDLSRAGSSKPPTAEELKNDPYFNWEDWLRIN